MMKEVIIENSIPKDIQNELKNGGYALLGISHEENAPADAVQLIVASPREGPLTMNTGSVTFTDPEALANLIEQLIAYRTAVFPDADPIDVNKPVKKGSNELEQMSQDLPSV